MILRACTVLLWAATVAQALPALGTPRAYRNSSSSAVQRVHPPFATGYSNNSHHVVEPIVSPYPLPTEGHNRFGFKGEQTATFANDGPMATLSPNIHWSWDTKDIANIEPIPPNMGSQMYYGIGDPSKAGHFAFLTYHFTSPSVNLDHSEHMNVIYRGTSGLKITFAHQEAFKLASDTWVADEGLVLIVFARGCGDYHSGERCYFKVSELDFKSGDLVINASGKPTHPDEIISSGETEWGWWSPPKPHQSHTQSPSTAPGASFNLNPTSTNSDGSGSGPTATITSSSYQSATISTGFATPYRCVAPPDDKYGLSTACLGQYFDQDLDSTLGYSVLNAESQNFLEEIAPHLINDRVSEEHHRRAIRQRSFRDWFNKHIVKPLKQAYQAVQKALSIGGSVNSEIYWQIPDPASGNSESNTLRDPDVKQATSPWGDAILLKSFGSQEPDKNRHLNGYMNVFCVGCGVSGNAKIAGRARWTPLGGFLEGQVELHTDIRFTLKIGIDAQLIYSQEFNSDLINVGLPGLSYGVVTIGPRITVGSRVELAAAAKGKLLAGAEMGLQNAMVLIDFVNSGNSKSSGWEPYFRPVFEAEGELMLSATLGLPVGIKCGLQISKWDKSVGLIDEPSIKGVAQVAASIGLTDKGTFSAGFTETNGCTGISTQISWRNKLWIDIFGAMTIPLLDTNDKVLSRGCIALPGRQTQPKYSNSTILTRTPRAPPTLHSRRSTDSSSTAIDLKSGVVGSTSNTLTYSVQPFTNSGYSDSLGFEFAPLVDPTNSTMVLSCSNGNMYAVLGGEENSLCSTLWATAEDGTVVHDGAQRLMHYYDDTMSKVGVSRLRVSVESTMPGTGVIVALVPYENKAGPEDYYYYVAVDPNDQVFYPLVCDFTDGTGSKVFLAKDPDEGISMLQSADVKYSVTGGKVKQCYALVLNRGTHTS